MASKVEIINSALRSLGAVSISAVDEDSENARKAVATYDICLRSLLRCHPWSFAKKESVLSRIAGTPILSDDYTYMYTLPSDYIRLTKTNQEPTYSHKIKGKVLYSNCDSISIEYVFYCTDTVMYDDTFVSALAAMLASELAYSITRDKDIAAASKKEFLFKLGYAKNINAMEVTPDDPTCDDWINARI